MAPPMSQTPGSAVEPTSGFLHVLSWIALTLIASAFLGICYAGLPTKLRVFWVGPVFAGGIAGYISVRLAVQLGLRVRTSVLFVGCLAGCALFASYTARSISQFAAVDAVESDESKAARAFLQSLEGDGAADRSTRPSTRWVRWRATAFGPLEPPWPFVVFWSEVVACGLAAGTTAVVASNDGPRRKAPPTSV